MWKPHGVTSQTTKTAGNEPSEPGHGTHEHEREVIEYVVLQRRMLKGVEEPWKLWGFVDKSTLEGVRKDERTTDAMYKYQQEHPELT